MNLRQLIKIIIPILTIILIIAFYYYSKHKNSAVTTIYVTDTTNLDGKLIWDKDKNLLNPNVYNEMLNLNDSIYGINTSLNGLVYYRIRKSSFEKYQVFKREYQKVHFYAIMNSDSVALMDTLKIEIGVNRNKIDDYTIDLQNDELFELKTQEFPESKVFIYQAYGFDSIGVNAFKGIIKIDGDEYPIVYRFVVK
ncbi:MAG: hypothetical protein AAFX87_12970 [Bacteroidota bacterium]